MAARAVSFKQADLFRALKATVAAGLEVGRVEIDPSGKITIMPAQKGLAETKRDSDEWDDLLK